jgi:hypothetical protein
MEKNFAKAISFQFWTSHRDSPVLAFPPKSQPDTSMALYLYKLPIIATHGVHQERHLGFVKIIKTAEIP